MQVSGGHNNNPSNSKPVGFCHLVTKAVALMLSRRTCNRKNLQKLVHSSPRDTTKTAMISLRYQFVRFPLEVSTDDGIG